MAVTVIADPGNPNANSYATVIQLESYAETRPHSTDLTAVTEDAKGGALIDATRSIDALHHRGWLTFVEGRLRQPRGGLYDRDSRMYDENVICDPMVEAVCEMALALLAADRRSDSPMAGYEEVEVGTLKFKADKLDRPPVIPNAAWDKITHLVLDARPGSIQPVGVITA